VTKVEPNGLGTQRRCFSAFVSPIHKRTEGRAPVWGSEFTTKFPPKGGFRRFSPRLNVNFRVLRGSVTD
jgi:hypothetical protein